MTLSSWELKCKVDLSKRDFPCLQALNLSRSVKGSLSFVAVTRKLKSLLKYDWTCERRWPWSIEIIELRLRLELRGGAPSTWSCTTRPLYLYLISLQVCLSPRPLACYPNSASTHSGWSIRMILFAATNLHTKQKFVNLRQHNHPPYEHWQLYAYTSSSKE